MIKRKMSKNQWVWGFSQEAEKWNGRLAMLAFSIIIIFEFWTSLSIVHVLALNSEI